MRNFLAYAAAKYEAGEPIISDAEFDRLEKIYGYDRVGAAIDISRAVPHAHRMYSLQKCFVGEKLIELPGEVIETPKLDGAAVSLLYVDGRLVLALTRGDGKAGLDITEKLRLLVPTRIGNKHTIQIEGEVAAPKAILNSRNYASGALGLKDMQEFRNRELTFVAYGMKPNMYSSYHSDLTELEMYGFETVLSDSLGRFPQDGRVFRVNDNALFEELGFTGKHPRGAFALKEIQEGVITTLEGVDWQVGRTGRVTPVALLKSIKIGDALVSRATLNNIAFIREMELEIGCQVEIIRSGEIIPKVIRRVN